MTRRNTSGMFAFQNRNYIQFAQAHIEVLYFMPVHKKQEI